MQTNYFFVNMFVQVINISFLPKIIYLKVFDVLLT